jgi:DNA-binding LytR/AlgR family response regulator
MTHSGNPRALIADDEPLLRRALARQLEQTWPELEIVAFARNGKEAIRLFDSLRPDICFLDVQMPVVSGVEAAAAMADSAHIVFVTAYHQYAVQAFERGAIDYLIKPLEPARLAQTVSRLQQRWLAQVANAPTTQFQDMLQTLSEQMGRTKPRYLTWLRASSGTMLRLIAVDDIDYFRAEDKYTTVAWRNQSGPVSNTVIRTAIKDLLRELDPNLFAQVHRAIVINLRAIDHVLRADNETALIHLKGRAEVLPVSRSFLHLFKQM